MNWTRIYAYTGAGVVGAVAAVVSFGHLRSLALGAGESPLAAALLPISVDGLLVSAASVMWLDSQAGRRARLSARVAFGAGCAATLAGNVASARPTVTGWLVAAWAPVALLLVTEMLARRARPAVPPGTPEKSATSEVATTVVPSGTGQRRRSTGKKPAAERVAAARAKAPAATQEEVKRRTGLSLRTVARYWRDAQPDGSAKLAEPTPNSREHGDVPELAEVGS